MNSRVSAVIFAGANFAQASDVMKNFGMSTYAFPHMERMLKVAETAVRYQLTPVGFNDGNTAVGFVGGKPTGWVGHNAAEVEKKFNKYFKQKQSNFYDHEVANPDHWNNAMQQLKEKHEATWAEMDHFKMVVDDVDLDRNEKWMGCLRRRKGMFGQHKQDQGDVKELVGKIIKLATQVWFDNKPEYWSTWRDNVWNKCRADVDFRIGNKHVSKPTFEQIVDHWNESPNRFMQTPVSVVHDMMHHLKKPHGNMEANPADEFLWALIYGVRQLADWSTSKDDRVECVQRLRKYFGHKSVADGSGGLRHIAKRWEERYWAIEQTFYNYNLNKYGYGVKLAQKLDQRIIDHNFMLRPPAYQ